MHIQRLYFVGQRYVTAIKRMRIVFFQVCKNDSDCGTDQFCPPFVLGLQRRCSSCLDGAGKLCYNNNHCCGTALCQWGQCTEGVTKGDTGTSCKRNSDCLVEQHCCALVDGTYVHVLYNLWYDDNSLLGIIKVAYHDERSKLGAKSCIHQLHLLRKPILY